MAELKSKPKKDGYRMPGEFEAHKRCWMLWPERPDNWRLNAQPAQEAFAAVAHAISEFEPVIVGVSKSSFNKARALLNSSVELVEIDYDDAWMRDVGPSFVIDEKKDVRAIDWRFNAWGGHLDGLYESWEKDDQVAKKVADLARKDYYSLKDFVLEGGSIHVDGQGTCIVTKACLLSPSRNPSYSQGDIEAILKDYLNVEKIIWLENGIYLDETNEHVDNILHYCHPGVVALAWTDDVHDPQYLLSKAAYDLLSETTDAKGRPLTIHKIHIPQTVFITEEEASGVVTKDGTLPRNPGDRQAASYVNFYIANGGIVFPLFGDDKQDQAAHDQLQVIFPNRQIKGVYAREIILGGGNIHCITQQEPLDQ